MGCPGFLSSAAAGGWAAVFHESEEIPFAAKAGLCALCELSEDLRIIVPAEDTSQINAATFVIDDEWIYLIIAASITFWRRVSAVSDLPDSCKSLPA